MGAQEPSDVKLNQPDFLTFFVEFNATVKMNPQFSIELCISMLGLLYSYLMLNISFKSFGRLFSLNLSCNKHLLASC